MRTPRRCAWTCSSRRSLERARRNAAGTPLHARLEPTIVAGVPARLERAVGNLIDNAVKYSPPGQPVEIGRCRSAITRIVAHRRADRARPRAGDLSGGPAARLRPLLPRRRGARAPRLRGWAWRSCARWSTSRAEASPPSRLPAAARSCACACQRARSPSPSTSPTRVGRSTIGPPSDAGARAARAHPMPARESAPARARSGGGRRWRSAAPVDSRRGVPRP